MKDAEDAKKISKSELDEKDEFDRKKKFCFIDLLINFDGSNFYTFEEIRNEAKAFISAVI
jgi:hypothetical protein